MVTRNPNPYEPDGSAETIADRTATWRQWPVIACVGVSVYYVVSALTLPFVNKLWCGELAPLAICQLPKSFLKSVIHQVLMTMVNSFGLSRGSFSPDYSATHGWAMGIMAAVPALSLIITLLLICSLPPRPRLIAALRICASIDAVVTLWFDNVSNLKLYNAVYV